MQSGHASATRFITIEHIGALPQQGPVLLATGGLEVQQGLVGGSVHMFLPLTSQV